MLSAMHEAGALEHSPTPTQPPTPAAPLLCCFGHPVTDFRNELSAREFRVSGLCQACQDDVLEPAVEFDRNIATQLADGTRRISSAPCTAPHWTSTHPGLSMRCATVQRPAPPVGPTNAAGDPSDDMGDGPQGADTADDAALTHDADSATLPDLDLRTTSEIAEAECACASTHTPVPHTSTTQDR